MQLIDGKSLAKQIRGQVRARISESGIAPGLAIILIGDNPASALYVSLKEKACLEVGVRFEKFIYSGTESSEEIIAKIRELNARPDIHGILVQLPLPPAYTSDDIVQSIDPAKDIDGFHTENIDALVQGKPRIIPPIHQGIVRLIESTGIETTGKKAAIFANSAVFALPLRKLLEDKKISVTVALPPLENTEIIANESDIIIVAVGRPKFISCADIKDNAVIIDCGTNKIDEKLFGDVDSETCAQKNGFITPVPGGVGPMTIAMLLNNLYELARK
ncbi:MAG: bifunctional 5,10-methylenetetrahydrofolate dehydrogenase/5,10-methenyltetrahydrofolate cyclohydrolase [Patescibacteria group bacterium]|nr:bifunctional 5,10-methylenetetrahydrofolate dehydrogenase/5,10-methenyltetrahydrofolate cyclohydrolase [Patescibacteria group bacterium]